MRFNRFRNYPAPESRLESQVIDNIGGNRAGIAFQGSTFQRPTVIATVVLRDRVTASTSYVSLEWATPSHNYRLPVARVSQ